MAQLRLIARLDIKAPNLIKGVHLEGLRVVGDPQQFARRYYEEGADELLYIDIVATLYGRNHLAEIVSRTVQDVFVPITVGGGVRSVDDVRALLRAGADKVAINTAAIKEPELVKKVARRFGSQCMVLSIEAKKVGPGRWEAYTDNGRERTGRDVVTWAKQAAELGAGEILLTSVDAEGTRKGFDVELTAAVSGSVPIPVIASGGMGTTSHLAEVVRAGHADAVAMADCLHYKRLTLSQIRAAALAEGFGGQARMITVVDYGMGNLMSVSRAFEAVGAQVRVSAEPTEIVQAERLVLPGVGAFGDGMRGLMERGLAEPIKTYASSGRPLLGICLGMQLLFDSSEEFGEFGGLGLVPGRVLKVPDRAADGRTHKIPHIGWSGIMPARDWHGTLLQGIEQGAATYFVHSYAPEPANSADRLADTFYDGCPISAVVQHGAIAGCQFHPEKSAAVGLRILANFAGANG